MAKRAGFLHSNLPGILGPVPTPPAQSEAEREAAISRMLGVGADEATTGGEPALTAARIETTPAASVDRPADELSAEVWLDVDRIDPSPYQPRLKFDPEALRELAESIEAETQIDPILVRARTGGRLELVAGERRWRAIRDLLKRKAIKGIVRTLSDRQASMLALTENVSREDLSDFERALAYKTRLDEGHASSQVDLARQTGQQYKDINRCLAMLKMPEAVLDILRDSPDMITARGAEDFIAYVQHDADLVTTAFETIHALHQAGNGEGAVTNQLNWLKAKSRERHDPRTAPIQTALTLRGRTLGDAACKGRKLVITAPSGMTGKDVLALITEIAKGEPQ
jgi:ParB family chromosome partitioning protein